MLKLILWVNYFILNQLIPEDWVGSLLDLEVFKALSIHFVKEEVWQLLAQLVEAV